MRCTAKTLSFSTRASTSFLIQHTRLAKENLDPNCDDEGGVQHAASFLSPANRGKPFAVFWKAVSKPGGGLAEFLGKTVESDALMLIVTENRPKQ